MTIDGAIVDLDGTVYRGDDLLPGADRGLRSLRAAGVEVVFVSNNPVRPPAEIADHLERLGVAATPERIVTSTVVAREYLLEHHSDDRLFVVGDPGVAAQLEDFHLVADADAVDVLLAAIDRSFTYDTLTDALHALRREGTVFLGTDPDRTIPTGGGDEIPGSGAIIGAIAAATEREPAHVFGKPSSFVVETALSRLGVPAASCLVVGDRLDTDVAMGNRVGAGTVLVRTGTHDEAAIDRIGETPDHVVDSLGSIESVLSR